MVPTTVAQESRSTALELLDRPRAISFQPEIYEIACGYLPEDLDAKLLDVGAGEGYLSMLIHERGYRNAHACDHCVADYKYPPVPFTDVDLNSRLPYEDDAFDCVFALEVAEHIEHHDNFFRELYRITRPGGRVVISTPNSQDLGSRLYFMTCGLTSAATRVFDPSLECWQQHVNYLTLQKLLYYVEHHGGKINELTTNRYRNSALFLLPLYPLLFGLSWLSSKRRRQRERGDLTWNYHRRALSAPMLLGRIVILVSEPGESTRSLAENEESQPRRTARDWVAR